MCHFQLSGPILASEAATPPCAATVCERVGNTLVIQACAAPPPNSRRSPAVPRPRPNDDDIERMIGNRIGGAIAGRSGIAIDCCAGGHAIVFRNILASLRGIRELANLTTGAVAPTGGDSGQAQFQGRENASQPMQTEKKRLAMSDHSFKCASCT